MVLLGAYALSWRVGRIHSALIQEIEAMDVPVRFRKPRIVRALLEPDMRFT